MLCFFSKKVETNINKKGIDIITISISFVNYFCSVICVALCRVFYVAGVYLGSTLVKLQDSRLNF